MNGGRGFLAVGKTNIDQNVDSSHTFSSAELGGFAPVWDFFSIL